MLGLDAWLAGELAAPLEGFRDANEVLDADDVCNVLLRGRCSYIEVRLLLSVLVLSRFPNGGREVTLNEGGGERCLIGMGAIRSLLATGAAGPSASSLLSLLLLLGGAVGLV